MSADLGKLLQDYQQGNVDSGLLSLLQGLHLPLSSQTTEFLSDEQDMSIASGRTGLFKGWSLPAGATSRNDFFALMTSGEQFAAASGWQYFPTPQQLQWAANNGVAQMTQQQQWTWMASLHSGLATSMPWLGAGMTKQAYTDYNARLTDVWQQYTGDTNSPGWALQIAAKQNWSAQRFQQWVQQYVPAQGSAFAGQYGWIKHGMTYNDFQQYKLNNKAQAAQRFGANAGDSQYLQMLDKPLTSFNAQGTAISTQPAAASNNPSAASFGRQGEAR